MPLISIRLKCLSWYTTSMEVVWQVHLKEENEWAKVDFVQNFS
uniref:Uncharacterized protein n=1 Tax=Enterobacter asburiae TaxID=61645 RepID=A0A455VPC8_ENTAS|nr:hypothetical protein MRY18106EAS_13060 [Enterobacter asburiae]